jgi:hypothetical protein
MCDCAVRETLSYDHGYALDVSAGVHADAGNDDHECWISRRIGSLYRPVPDVRFRFRS